MSTSPGGPLNTAKSSRFSKFTLVSALTVASSALAGCASLAVWSAPEKVAMAESTPAARAANDQFWQALHRGRYEDLPQVLDALTAVYLQNPNDAETAAHIGFSHVWRVSES